MKNLEKLELSNEFKTQIKSLLRQNLCNSLKKNKLNNVSLLSEQKILELNRIQLIEYLQTEMKKQIQEQIQILENFEKIKHIEKLVMNRKTQTIFSDFIKEMNLVYEISNDKIIRELYTLHVNSVRTKQSINRNRQQLYKKY